MIIQVKQLTQALRLNGIHNAIERRAHEALANNLHPLEFARLVLEEELLYRKDVASRRLTSKAKFTLQSCFEDWDHTFDRGVTKQKLNDLAALNFRHNQESLIILGKTGEGKTQLAIALGKRFCQEGHSAQFHTVSLLFEEVLSARASGKYLKFIRDIKKIDLLILDDFGLRNYTHAEATVLMDVLDGRYRQGSVIVTSQVDPMGWTKLFEDPVIGEAIVDRLKNPSQKIVLKGGSYRERLKAKEGGKSLTPKNEKG